MEKGWSDVIVFPDDVRSRARLYAVCRRRGHVISVLVFMFIYSYDGFVSLKKLFFVASFGFLTPYLLNGMTEDWKDAGMFCVT